jgi:hypothetical protein
VEWEWEVSDVADDDDDDCECTDYLTMQFAKIPQPNQSNKNHRLKQ